MAYANGQLPASALVKISSGHLLRADAAAGFEAMSAAFRARFGYALGVSDGYRPLNGISTPAFSYPHAYSQVGIFENRYPSLVSLGVPDRRGPYKSKYWWRRPGTAAAAVPGTSNHGWGVALDLASNVNRLNSTENLWVRANSTRFGWVWPSWAQKFPSLEPWHYEFVGTVSYPVGGGGGSISIPSIPGLPGSLEEDDVPWNDKFDKDVRGSLQNITDILVPLNRDFRASLADAHKKIDAQGKELTEAKAQLLDVQLRVASIHGKGFQPWKPGAPGGSLSFLDEKLKATAAEVTTAILGALPGTAGVDKAQVAEAVRGAVGDAFEAATKALKEKD